MVENESYKSTALSLLTRYLKFQHWTSSVRFHVPNFNFVAPGDEIPKWYNHQSLGSLITIELHPGWFTNKWMGFTFCVVFRLLNPLPPLFQWSIKCSLKSNGKVYGRCGTSFGRQWGQPVLDHIWFFCGHRDYFIHRLEWQDIYQHLEFSFKFNPGECQQVKKCGVRMIYEEDVEELWHVEGKST
ncbi:hypothetical protein RchiOBHm_Chr6g0249691 [Rosa chinensis]|uniref:C-JID domain-containing protein n=1 Tax=Rosa chinensis TaxID=74649 RepID=A0A2P6PKD1_ROSCH|nr:hypothetical protein RchiOBHm_Chr6g0249691 [Rosa chinensis]